MAASSSNDMENVIRNMFAIITSFVSLFVVNIVLPTTGRIEMTVIVVVLVVSWIAVDGYIRQWIRSTPIMGDNKRWRDVILAVLDFLLMLSVFLVAQLLLKSLSNSVQSSEMSTVETVVLILVLLFGAFAFMHNIKAMNAPLDDTPADLPR